MVYEKHGPETSVEERTHQRLQLVYKQQTHQRQIFMEDLNNLRKRQLKTQMKKIRNSIGPIWYQVLSVPQRQALDTLEFSIYQDLIERRPTRTSKVIRYLGIYPQPNNGDLMECVLVGQSDTKAMLAHLFLLKYDHSFDLKRSSYDLNARLIMSAILYLGLNNLIHLLKKRFQAEPVTKVEKAKPRPKPKPPLESPYLQKMVAFLYEPRRFKRSPPAPLPDIDDLNEPIEEDPQLPKPPPPPPPPPPPKKRLPWELCDKIANVMRIEPHVSAVGITKKAMTCSSQRRMRTLIQKEDKKQYGIGFASIKPKQRRKKLTAPCTGSDNAQYTINGVYTVHGKTTYVVGNVCILPADGELIHGGYKYINGDYINIHRGFRLNSPPPLPNHCDCVKKYNDTVQKYIKSSKCMCGHNFDYGNEGTFGPEELPYFERATRKGPYQFNYSTIYDLDSRSLHIGKEFKRIWETDSMLRVDDGSKDKKDKKKKKKKSSNTCLGDKPKPSDYLRCALRQMRRLNLASRLPDIHLVPELQEWMRYRMYGPFSSREKAAMLHRSNAYLQVLTGLTLKGFGHVYPPKDPTYSGHTTWLQKHSLNEKFRIFAQDYKVQLFRSQANIINLLWPIMCQAQFPDKKFREIYFCYLFGRLDDLQLMHPYCARESMERKTVLLNKRYVCLPAGVETDS